MRSPLLVVYVYVLLSSCVTPYEVTTAFQPTFVVDGMITDQPGPYVVHLSNAIPINDQLQETGVVQGATVTVHDDQGATEVLVEKNAGSYYTTSFQGVVGRSYFITVTTSDGNSYQSTPEALLPVGDFTNLRFEFVQNEPPAIYGQIKSTNGFDLFLDSEVLPEQEGRVWWRWTGTFHIFTYPSLRTKPGNGPGLDQVPDPPLCARHAGPCTCCDCWVTQYNQSPLISDTRFVNNGKITGVHVAFVEANPRTFYDKYHLAVDQMSVSSTIYNFWKEIKQQKENSDNLFQTPPPKAKGNMVVSSAHAIPVIGYFAASSIKTHVVEMTRADVPYPMPQIDVMKVSCTEVYKNSSATKPDFW
jgi:hypothetical protein